MKDALQKYQSMEVNSFLIESCTVSPIAAYWSIDRKGTFVHFQCASPASGRGEDMAIFYLHHDFKGRSNVRSIVAAAAYRSGDTLTDERTGRVHNYSRKAGILHAEIGTPKDAPPWASIRSELWNRLEFVESHSTRPDDAQLARSLEIALPHELTTAQQVFLVRDFVHENFTRKGFVADWAIHAPHRDGNGKNFHAHILVPMRPIEGRSFAKRKPRTFGQQSEIVRQWRRRWARLANRHLARHGIKAEIDERPRGRSQAPTAAVWTVRPSGFRGMQRGTLSPLPS